MQVDLNLTVTAMFGQTTTYVKEDANTRQEQITRNENYYCTVGIKPHITWPAEDNSRR